MIGARRRKSHSEPGGVERFAGDRGRSNGARVAAFDRTNRRSIRFAATIEAGNIRLLLRR
jgi:hypothetical protein